MNPPPITLATSYPTQAPPYRYSVPKNSVNSGLLLVEECGPRHLDAGDRWAGRGALRPTARLLGERRRALHDCPKSLSPSNNILGHAADSGSAWPGNESAWMTKEARGPGLYFARRTGPAHSVRPDRAPNQRSRAPLPADVEPYAVVTALCFRTGRASERDVCDYARQWTADSVWAWVP